jgi:dihydrofolate reductase
MNPFLITIHMVSSVDGMVATKDNDVSWFEIANDYEKGVTGQDPEEFLQSIDCYVMGSHTYELALELSKTYGWAYGDKPTIVLTSRQLSSERTNIEFYSGNLHQLVESRLKTDFKSVWVVGGPALAKEFICAGLADELRVSILPVILGDGLRFFDQIARQQALHLKDVVAYKNGMVELCYEILKQ